MLRTRHRTQRRKASKETLPDHVRPHRVVIVGGGFAGLFAARVFRNRPVAVTLIDKSTHHLFQPLLYQCATGVLSEGQIAAPLRSVLKRHDNVEVLLAEVVDVRPEQRRVVAKRIDGSTLEVGYDDLVVAAGAGPSYFGHEEFARYAPGMKTLGDALAVRQRVFRAFEMAESATSASERKYWLTFALVGAGPTGVELAGQIRELATHTLRKDFHRIEPEEAHVMLFDGGSAPLASFGPKLAKKTARALTRLGVELHLDTLVTDVDARGIEVRHKDSRTERHDAGTVLWTAGVAAPPLADALAKATGAEQDRAGRIKVRPDLTIDGHPEISVVGDMMRLDSQELPGVAEVAMQAGHYAAARIRDRVEGRRTGGRRRKFKYYDLGVAAYIARGRAVIRVGPFHANGLVGWFSWLFLHIAFLTGFRNRIGAVLSWLVAFSAEARRERAFPGRDIESAQEMYAIGSRSGRLGGADDQRS